MKKYCSSGSNCLNEVFKRISGKKFYFLFFTCDKYICRVYTTNKLRYKWIMNQPAWAVSPIFMFNEVCAILHGCFLRSATSKDIVPCVKKIYEVRNKDHCKKLRNVSFGVCGGFNVTVNWWEPHTQSFTLNVMSNVSDSICNTGLCTNLFIPVVQTKESYKKFPKYKFWQ